MTEYEAPGLFDVEAVPALTATARRRARQQRVVGAGFHPLTKGRLHPDAIAGDATTPTCGSCAFRRPIRGHIGDPPKEYPKCTYPAPGRMTRGPGTDVLATWPACLDYRPKGRD